MKKLIIILVVLIIFILLTAATQIGGLVFLLSLLISKKIKIQFRMKGLVTFLVLYLIITFIIIPLLAPLWGREKIDGNSHLKPANFMTVVLNRNYVTPKLNAVLTKASNELAESNNKIQIRYLDACFPFFVKFPLIPHLSHNDGNKIDLAFVYENESGQIINKSKSVSGYGVFEEPLKNEFDQTNFCKQNGFPQYDYSKYFTFGKINTQLKFSKKGTRTLINAVLNQNEVEKIFIEPHLKTRMNLGDERIRYQGCWSVRHDDHIHLQIK